MSTNSTCLASIRSNELLARKLNIKNLLASCPLDPKRSKLPLPSSVSTLHPEVFIDSLVEGETFLEDGTYSSLVDDLSLLPPILYSVFSDSDFEIMLSPLPVAQPRKPLNHKSTNGDKQGFYLNNNYQHSNRMTKGNYQGDLSEFSTYRRGRRPTGPRNNSGNAFQSNRGYGEGHHTHPNFHPNSNHSYHTRPGNELKHPIKKSMDSIISQFESMEPYKPRGSGSLTEDPWEYPSNVIGSFDTSGNFVFTEDKKELISQKPSKIPIQQSRLSSIISSKIITAESLEATLIQSTIGPEKEICVSIPFYNMWYYRDPSGIIQGPFPAEQMAHWSDAGYFDEKMQVRPDIESASSSNHSSHFLILSDFVPLAEWISLYNDYLPWSFQARNIVYSVKQPYSTEHVKDATEEKSIISPKDVNLNTVSNSSIEKQENEELSTPGASEIYTVETQLIQQEEGQCSAGTKSEASSVSEPLPSSPIAPVGNSITTIKPVSTFKGWKTSSSGTVVPISSILQNKNKTSTKVLSNSTTPKSADVKPVIRQSLSTWSSIASSGVQTTTKIPNTKFTTESKIVPSAIRDPSILKSNHSDNISDTSNTVGFQPKKDFSTNSEVDSSKSAYIYTNLENWVISELTKLKIKNIDGTILTNLLVPLSAGQMKEILTDFISTANIDEFIVGFNSAKAELSSSSTIGVSQSNPNTSKKKDSRQIINENDGFSVVARKAKKPSTLNASTHQVTSLTKRIVGL